MVKNIKESIKGDIKKGSKPANNIVIFCGTEQVFNIGETLKDDIPHQHRFVINMKTRATR